MFAFLVLSGKCILSHIVWETGGEGIAQLVKSTTSQAGNLCSNPSYGLTGVTTNERGRDYHIEPISLTDWHKHSFFKVWETCLASKSIIIN